MNIGLIFCCFVCCAITGTMIYEILIIYLNVNTFVTMTIVFFFEVIILFLVYFINSFNIRIIILSLFHLCIGCYNPLNSIIKAKILNENYRTLLMNMFRVPLNFYVIIVLLFLKYMNPFHLCLIASFMMAFAFLVSLSLYIWPTQSLRN